MQTVCPGQVRTNMTKNLGNHMLEVSAKDVVSQALNTVGIESTTYDHWKHKALFLFYDIFVKSVFGERFCSKLIFLYLNNERTNYYNCRKLNDTL
jgi:hypothetical protein